MKELQNTPFMALIGTPPGEGPVVGPRLRLGGQHRQLCLGFEHIFEYR